MFFFDFLNQTAGSLLSERIGSVGVESCYETIVSLGLSHIFLNMGKCSIIILSLSVSLSSNPGLNGQSFMMVASIPHTIHTSHTDQPSSHELSRKHWALSCPPLVSAGQHRAELAGEHSSEDYVQSEWCDVTTTTSLTCTGRLLSALMRKLGVLTLNWWTSFMVDIVVLTGLVTTRELLSPLGEWNCCDGCRLATFSRSLTFTKHRAVQKLYIWYSFMIHSD